MFFSKEQEALDDEMGAAWGDPRRCPIHPNVRTSSADGMFDGLCGACEGEMSQRAAQWDIDPTNPYREACGRNETPYGGVNWYPYLGSRYGTAGCLDVADSEDNIPF